MSQRVARKRDRMAKSGTPDPGHRCALSGLQGFGDSSAPPDTWRGLERRGGTPAPRRRPPADKIFAPLTAFHDGPVTRLWTPAFQIRPRCPILAWAPVSRSRCSQLPTTFRVPSRTAILSLDLWQAGVLASVRSARVVRSPAGRSPERVCVTAPCAATAPATACVLSPRELARKAGNKNRGRRASGNKAGRDRASNRLPTSQSVRGRGPGPRGGKHRGVLLISRGYRGCRANCRRG